jgi:hypothetical protein
VGLVRLGDVEVVKVGVIVEVVTSVQSSLASALVVFDGTSEPGRGVSWIFLGSGPPPRWRPGGWT